MTKLPTQKHLVLYADDDIDDLEIVEEAFSEYSGYVELLKFPTGDEIMQYLNGPSISPCLIILDINMPGLNGKDVLRQLRMMDKYVEVPVVLFSTSNSFRDHQFARDYKAGFITKPLDINQMEMIAEQFIDHCSDDIKEKIRTKLQ